MIFNFVKLKTNKNQCFGMRYEMVQEIENHGADNNVLALVLKIRKDKITFSTREG